MNVPPLLCFVLCIGALHAEVQPGIRPLVRIEGCPSSRSGVASAPPTAALLFGKFEVTQREWIEVMGANPSKFIGDELPVDSVTWYDSIVYCNKRSVREGLSPCYTIERERKDPDNQNTDDAFRWSVSLIPGANGYRLPTEAEWEFAARGGMAAKGFTYSGSNTLDSVGWHWRNSGERYLLGFWNWPAIEQNRNRTRPVGGKEPNELGLHDMSGNVREWCWEHLIDRSSVDSPANTNPVAFTRIWKGGSWMGSEFCCEPSFRGSYEPAGIGTDQGLRVCRNAD